MPPNKLTPRAEYREQEAQRVAESPSLAETFPKLKSLTLESDYFNPLGVTRNREIKFQPNLERAKSLFRVDCVNQECVGGDFDLSAALAQAVADGETTVTGEMVCQGWRNRTTIHEVHCHDILRYKITLGYHPATAKKSGKRKLAAVASCRSSIRPFKQRLKFPAGNGQEGLLRCGLFSATASHPTEPIGKSLRFREGNLPPVL